MEHDRKRFDIQLLRGVAVLAVVVFHAFRDGFPKGYLGVDVFFVISGFLITGMILRQLEAGNFTFRGFYLRRARRLLPASLSTFAITTALALWLLTPGELADFAKQLFGALTFTANFALMAQSGYFEGAAAAKPLLHIWSLSLEEQFYFVAPLLLWLTPRRWRVPVLVVGAVLSFVLCNLLVSDVAIPGVSAKAGDKIAFFMLPPRAWELLIGGIAAAAMLRWPGLRVPGWAKYAALAAILFVCVSGVSRLHPGPDALIAGLATATILLGRDDWLHANPITRMIARIGDWSYSVYLVHWPLFAFAYILYLQHPPVVVALGLLAAAILLGWAQYRFVEERFRRSLIERPRRAWGAIAAATGLLAVAGVTTLALATPVDPNLAPATGLAVECDQSGAAWRDRPACRTSPQPTVLLWGDSHAMHLVPGILSVLGNGQSLIQTTLYSCAPVPGVVDIRSENAPGWAGQCERHNANVAAQLARLPSVRTVIISSVWTQLFTGGPHRLRIDGVEGPWRPIAAARLEQSVRAAQAAGKTVILMGPTPRAPFDVGACNARMLSGRLVPFNAGCKLGRGAIEPEASTINRAFVEIGRRTGATVLLPTDVLCDAQQCQTVLNGVSLYRDEGHLSMLGSRLLTERLGLRALLNR
jgi:peptidoglycan/LPS O-acetylase OafA/YrhL